MAGVFDGVLGKYKYNTTSPLDLMRQHVPHGLWIANQRAGIPSSEFSPFTASCKSTEFRPLAKS